MPLTNNGQTKIKVSTVESRDINCKKLTVSTLIIDNTAQDSFVIRKIIK